MIRRLGSRVLSVLVFIAVLAAGYAITAVVPSGQAEHRPFITGGEVNAPVQTRLFDVKVTSVKFASKIKITNSLVDRDKVLTTGGVWVLVHLSFTATEKPARLKFAFLRSADGRSFRATDRVSGGVTDSDSQPGIPVEGDVLFEIPQSALTAGLAIQLAANSVALKDAMAEVSLVADGSAKWVDPEPVAYSATVKV